MSEFSDPIHTQIHVVLFLEEEKNLNMMNALNLDL